MTTPQKGNSGASAKGSPAPKSGQAMTKAPRAMRVRPTGHAAPNNAIVTRYARAAVQAVKTVGRGVASAVSSILSAGGGTMVLVLLLTVILVAAIVASPLWYPLFQREPGSGCCADLCGSGADQL